MNIIMVDDDSNLLKMVQEHLTYKGHNVLIAMDSNEFFKRLQETKPDLIIIDINIPGMSGGEIFKQIRETEQYKNVPVIIWSGIAVKEGEVITLQNQKVKFLKKPFSISLLEDKIKEVIEEVADLPIVQDYDYPEGSYKIKED